MKEFRYVMACLGQVIANALAGGLAFAVVGALCGALTGFILGLVWQFSVSDAFGLACYGALVGVACGVVGVLIHFFSIVGARADDFWEPFTDLTPRVARGQFWGTVVGLTGFFVFELVNSFSNNLNFAENLQNDAILIALFAPISMICVAIGAAIFGRN